MVLEEQKKIIQEFQNIVYQSREDREHAEMLLKKLREAKTWQQASDIIWEIIRLAEKRGVAPLHP